MSAFVTGHFAEAFRTRRTRAAILAVALFLLPATAARADGWLSGDKATGDWGGERSTLAEHGVQLDADYVAESFVRDDKAITYRGNVDVVLQVDSEKAGLWKGGSFLAFGQNGHGNGVSDALGLTMPVSNYEAQDFTQLSELWLYQELPLGVAVRLGKQDANRDFASPRFGGNFINSSDGVLPTSPMPSFPAPALGAALFVKPLDWFNVRGGVYDGAPRVESFDGSAFEQGGGVFAIGAARIETGGDGPRDVVLEAGGWDQSEQRRSGGYALADVLFRVSPGPTGARRSLQLFARTNFEPDAKAPDSDFYVGGGLTAHGYVGANNTVGIGSGHVSLAGDDETYIEMFFKWRPMHWFTVEPDVQVYFAGGETHVAWGLRTRVKL